MNPYATESPLRYKLRNCDEDIAQMRAERRLLQAIRREAVRTNTTEWIAPVDSKLKQFRVLLNRLCARRSHLHRQASLSPARLELNP
jgi:hypothetical protein